MLHVPGMPEGVHVSFSPEDQPVSAPAQPTRYAPSAPEGAGTPSAALTALLDAHELAYGHALCSEAYGLPDLAERRQAEEEAFRALLHTPMQSDADRVAYAIAVISRQMHSLGDGSATERDHPMAVAYRNLRFGEHAREPEAMRHVGRVSEQEPETTADPILATIAASKAATAAFDAFAHKFGEATLTPEQSAHEDALSSADLKAQKAVWQTVPTTPAGRRALVEFARFRVARNTHPDGDVDDSGHLFGQILDTFAAMVDADPTEAGLRSEEADALALLSAIEREWAAEIIGDREDRTDLSAKADARSDARMERRHALLKAAEALPAGSREARHAKALAFAWDASIMLWQADRTRDQYGTDGRLMLDLMDSLTGDASAPAASLTVASATPTAADPHVALLPALRQAYAWTRDAQPIINESKVASPEYSAAEATQDHCWRLADRILALPAPTTPAGLGAVALAMAVWTEGFIGLGPERYDEERRTASAIRAMMSVAGVTPMPEWSGFGDEPDSKARWDAMMKRAGAGSLPGWAVAGKSSPASMQAA